MQDVAVTTVAHVIQLAVAPVFLLSGIGAMLAVMTHRLARVVDRARGLEAQLAAPLSETGVSATGGVTAATTSPGSPLYSKLSILAHRARLVSRAILLCTLTALLICTVIVVLFLGAWFDFNTALPVSILFVAAMLVFIAGLLTFLREVFLALSSLQIGSL